MGWRRWALLSATSELNLLTGCCDLVFITSLETRSENAESVRRIAGLWAARQILVVTTAYLILAFGAVLSALVTGLCALLIHAAQTVRILGAVETGKVSGPPGLLPFLVSYVSVVNFLFGFPFRFGPGPHYLWMLQILLGFVGVGLLVGYAFTVPVLRQAYGCYAQRPITELGIYGICPELQSAWVNGSEATCYNTNGAIPVSSHCQELPWAATIGAPVFHVARVIFSISLGVYISAVGRVYTDLSV